MVSSLVGARALYVVLSWKDFQNNLLAIVIPPYEGLVFYGGLLLAFPTVYFYLRAHHLSPWEMGDILAPAIALGQAIGRWGCFLNGCCFGCPTTLPWGVKFPQEAPATIIYGPVAVHPSQIYESLGCLAIFGVLALLLKKRRFPGQVVWSYVLLYGALRFLLEYLRGDDRGFTAFTLSISQWISIPAVLLALGMLFYARRRVHPGGKK
jgi:phosphatidylglycerol:prolipoprotein diacylglycerol transferase